jgi:hypothetical protein
MRAGTKVVITHSFSKLHTRPRKIDWLKVLTRGAGGGYTLLTFVVDEVT